MSPSSTRRSLVNLWVAAGSAALFAVAWSGITRADSAQFVQTYNEQPSAAVAAVVAVPRTTAAAIAPAAPTATAAVATGTMQSPNPTPVRRVVIVRSSRAS